MTSSEHIMITGAASGVGRACTKQFAKERYSVLACVRRDNEAAEMSRLDPAHIIPVIMDLQDQETIDRAVQQVIQVTGEKGLKGLVNCAGTLFCGPLEYFPREHWFPQYDVNVFGTMAVTQAVLPHLRRGRGRIITIGAVGGGLALPFYGAIASSKAALEDLNDCLRRELRPWGIHVIMIDPGGIDTPANDKMRASVKAFLDDLDPLGKARYGKAMDRFSRWTDRFHKHNLKPEQVAQTVFKAYRARHPRIRYRRGADSRLAALFTRFFPQRLQDMVLLKFVRLPARFGAWKGKKEMTDESKSR